MSWLDQFFNGYKTVESDGSPAIQQPILNFIPLGGSVELTNNPENNSTDITILNPGAIVGSALLDINSIVAEIPKPSVLCAAGQTTTIGTLPGNSIAFKELVLWAVQVLVEKNVGGPFGYIGRMIAVTNTSPGIITTPTGGNADWDITANATGSMNAALAGVTAAIVVGGSTLTVQVTNPLGFDVYAGLAESSVSRRLLPGTGPTATVTALSPTHGPGAGGIANNITLTGTNFTSVTGVSVDGVAAVVVSINGAGTSMVVTPGAFSGSPPSTGAVIVTNVNGPGTDMTSGYTYDTSVTPLPILRGATMWYESSTGVTLTGGVSPATAWADQSGNGFDLGSGSNTYHATDASINGAPSIVGASPSGIHSTNSVSQPVTVYVVGYQSGGSPAEIVSGATVRVSIGVNGGAWFIYAGGSIVSGGAIDTNDHAFCAIFTNAVGNCALYIDNSTSTVASGAAGTNAIGEFMIGSTSTGATGAVAEVVIIPGIDTQPQRSAMFQYLAAKYGNSWS